MSTTQWLDHIQRKDTGWVSEKSSETTEPTDFSALRVVWSNFVAKDMTPEATSPHEMLRKLKKANNSSLVLIYIFHKNARRRRLEGNLALSSEAVKAKGNVAYAMPKVE